MLRIPGSDPLVAALFVLPIKAAHSAACVSAHFVLPLPLGLTVRQWTVGSSPPPHPLRRSCGLLTHLFPHFPLALDVVPHRSVHLGHISSGTTSHVTLPCRRISHTPPTTLQEGLIRATGSSICPLRVRPATLYT
ncbi:uncharacterized protein B0T23DRAFT_55563 [Neurospora hispaniola]|uniref:Uncharacterized protein n=1 Tax=Neurospora hispaniola TaxID=588809 RepID=A0AAJ0MLK4_9PEZI|nr:hypothetical protein B0T23DRAFT_55563 [Neurospora hispaniola]